MPESPHFPRRPKDPKDPRFDPEAVQALGRLVDQVLDVPANRRKFLEDPPREARKVGIDVSKDKKMKRVVFTLAEMSPEELRLVSELNRRLIAEGLYVETGNPPVMIY